MDTVAEAIEKTDQTMRLQSETPETKQITLVLFADDLKIQAQNETGLQKALDTATKWADEHGMTWGTSKCQILTRPEKQKSTKLRLADSILATKTKTTYLGIEAAWNGVVDDKQTERIRKATSCLHALNRCGINTNRFNSVTISKVCKTFVIPKATYGIHLAQLKQETKDQWETLEKRIIQATLGWHTERRKPRLRAIARITSLDETVGMLMESLMKRLEERARRNTDDEEATQDVQRIKKMIAEIPNRKNTTRTEINNIWKAANERSRRKLPPNRRKWIPALRMRKRNLREAAIRWFCGAFPKRPGWIKRQYGTEAKKAIMHMQTLMPKQKWVQEEEDTVAEAIQYLTTKEPSTWQ